MKVTNIRFRDIATFLGISGILLLTATSYVERRCCRCSVYKSTQLPADASSHEVEAMLRSVLRNHRLLPRAVETNSESGKNDVPR